MTDPGRLARQREQLTRWVRDHGQAVQGFLQALVRDRDVAEDLLQEVFCRAWQARDRYREVGKERGYLLRIADRLACDKARRPRREQVLAVADWQRIEPAADADPPWEGMARSESHRQLAAALDALSEPQRRTLLLRFFGNLEFSEIAAVLDCPLNTVLSHNRRGLIALRQLLQEKS
ncbi:MAG TPA: RNA polymerase sigma factor [Pirellulales bacterium]|jgi:RNA polymerase sigma-70 factor (ECF subfamily)|nr:RNA polymerase sigma factor [Pirellulales bacterium]